MILDRFQPKRLIIYSRDELKQFEMAERLNAPCMRYFIGDVRDRERLVQAMHRVDYVIHAAALKQVPAAEYNPTECIKTNIHGAENVIHAALANEVEKVIALSTDKAANPVNLYGATKLASDKLFVAANNIAGGHKTRFRGSQIWKCRGVARVRSAVFQAPHTWRALLHLPMTGSANTVLLDHPDTRRRFRSQGLRRMSGGEIFVPRIQQYAERRRG